MVQETQGQRTLVIGAGPCDRRPNISNSPSAKRTSVITDQRLGGWENSSAGSVNVVWDHTVKRPPSQEHLNDVVAYAI